MYNKERDIPKTEELVIRIKDFPNEGMKIVFTKRNKNKPHYDIFNYVPKSNVKAEIISKFKEYIIPAVEKVVPDYVKELIS